MIDIEVVGSCELLASAVSDFEHIDEEVFEDCKVFAVADDWCEMVSDTIPAAVKLSFVCFVHFRGGSDIVLICRL